MKWLDKSQSNILQNMSLQGIKLLLSPTYKKEYYKYKHFRHTTGLLQELAEHKMFQVGPQLQPKVLLLLFGVI
jgi:hypothetical protein